MMYQCKLISRQNMLKELFYREGESKKDVLEGLDLYKWGRGTRWEIKSIEEVKEEQLLNSNEE